MGFLCSLYQMNYRTSKWTIRVILHLLNMSIVNSWIEYREIERAKGRGQKDIFDLLAFRDSIAEVLCNAELCTTRSKGRPSLLHSYPCKKIKTSIFAHNGFDHWQETEEMKSAQQYKLGECSGKSCRKCIECIIFLCLNSARNCFSEFHKNI